MKGDQLNLAEMDGKWERVEEEGNNFLVRGVPFLRNYLEALKLLTEGEVYPRRCLRVMRQAVAYLMVDASGLGFGSVMWSQRRLVLEAGYFTPLYQGISYNYRRGGT